MGIRDPVDESGAGLVGVDRPLSIELVVKWMRKLPRTDMWRKRFLEWGKTGRFFRAEEMKKE